MNRVTTTVQSLLQGQNRGAYEELCGRLRSGGKNPEVASWEYEWSMTAPRYRPQDHIRDISRGRVPSLHPHESDIRVSLRVLVDGRFYAQRMISLAPPEVLRAARPHLG